MQVKVRKKNTVPAAESKQHPVSAEKPEKKSKRRTFKEFLKENKIFFETLLAVTLSAASLIVSFAALRQDSRAVEDNYLLNLPAFDISWQATQGPIVDQGIEIPAKYAVEYRITNHGGGFSNGRAKGLRVITVSVSDEEYAGIARIPFVLGDAFVNFSGKYDAEAQCFRLCRYQENMTTGKMVDAIEERLIREYPWRFEITWMDYAKITYTDYRGNQQTKWYDLYDGQEITDPGAESEHYLYNFHSGDPESVFEQIRKILDQTVQEKTG